MTTVHTFTALGQYLAADVNSGAVHVLDKLTYDLLSGAGRGPWGRSFPLSWRTGCLNTTGPSWRRAGRS